MTTKLSLEAAYAKLSEQAEKMADLLRKLAIGNDWQADYAARVRADAVERVVEYDALVGKMPEPKRFFKLLENDKGEHIRIVDADTGVLILNWADANNNLLRGKPLSLDDAREAVTEAINAGQATVSGDWHLVEDHGRTIMLPPVQRVASNMLRMGDSVYMYSEKSIQDGATYRELTFGVVSSPEQTPLTDVASPAVQKQLAAFLGYEHHYPVCVETGHTLKHKYNVQPGVVTAVIDNVIYTNHPIYGEGSFNVKQFFKEFNSIELNKEIAELAKRNGELLSAARAQKAVAPTADTSKLSLG